MSTSVSMHVGEPSVQPDGSILSGVTTFEPWPSLRIRPHRTMMLTHEILWANPGGRLWPYTARIPRLLLSVVRTSPTNPWELLELAASAPERGCELIRQCPALAILLARTCPLDCSDRADHYCRLLSLTWRQMLPEIGLPPERRTVRLLRKIPLLHCREETLEVFCTAIRSRHRHLRILSHLRQVTRDTVALLALPPALVSGQLLVASASSDYDATPVRLCVDTITWFREMESPGCIGWPYRQLDAESLMRVANRYRLKFGADSSWYEPFPAPPLAGVPGQISALRDYWTVAAEADEQDNCAISLVPEVLAGNCYIYSVTVSERATLLLRRIGESRLWVVEDLRAESNGPVSDRTAAYVQAWLRECQR